MPKKKNSTYFTHKIPQSEYRNLKEKTEADRTKIDTDLEKLSIKDITKIFVEEKNVSKKEIYNYCLLLKNEN